MIRVETESETIVDRLELVVGQAWSKHNPRRAEHPCRSVADVVHPGSLSDRRAQKHRTVRILHARRSIRPGSAREAPRIPLKLAEDVVRAGTVTRSPTGSCDAVEVNDDDLTPATITQILPVADAGDVKRLSKSTRPTSVTRQWARLQPLLTLNLKVDYFGASEEDIAEAATCPWPDELRELYRCVERADDRRGMLLLPPSFEVLPLSGLVSLHALWGRLSSSPVYGVPVDVASEMAKPAGSPAADMLPGFIPFASSDANTLFVDTRPGPLHGSVNLWPDQDWPREPPLWRSPSAMLDDLASALERNAPLAMRMALWGKYQPYVEDDRLVWEPLS